MRARYLFIRILEACNAGCFMCDFAHSADGYRFGLDEFETLVPKARAVGVEYIRFTGGEPLMHRDLGAMISAASAAGISCSVITNGALLSRQVKQLAESGLAQVIVSIDGDTAESHDRYRDTPGLFERCITGLRVAADLDVMTRVNTVVGPHNYVKIPRLQQLLAQLGVGQWELSALKLADRVSYPDPAHVQEVCEAVYRASPRPMGKRFYGDTACEQKLFFESGIPPRASTPRCHLVGDVIYLDGKAGRGYGCSLLPHRDSAESDGGARMRDGGDWTLDTAEYRDHVARFHELGPERCTGCSTTAAGYSDTIARLGQVGDWGF